MAKRFKKGPAMTSDREANSRREKIRRLLRLYAVTDGNRTGVRELEEVLDGGVTCVQLREKSLPFEPFLVKAREFRRLCSNRGIPLIINDAIDVAEASGADGVHLGQGDGSPKEARKRLGEGAIIGVSVHSVAESLTAEEAGADYLGVGAIFPTSTKGDAERISIPTLRQITAATALPVVAIGGIGGENLSRLAGTGIAGVAVVSAIFGSPDPTAAATQLTRRTAELFTE